MKNCTHFGAKSIGFTDHEINGRIFRVVHHHCEHCGHYFGRYGEIQ